MTPPARRTRKAEQARRLGGDAVRGHELLLLAERVEEAERVHAEAEHTERAQREQAEAGRRENPQALPRARRRQHEERQHQSCRQLHADARRESSGSGAWAGAHARGDRERDGEREHHERVVVGAADGEHEQHRVEPDERRRPARGVSEALRCAGDEPDRREARGGRETLQRPQSARDTERRRGVAGEREQRAVGGVLERPADVREDGIRRRFCRDVRVGVEPVQRAHAREREVAEHVFGDQRRAEHEDHVGEHDGAGERRDGKPAGADEHEPVAGAHQEHQQLEGAAREV